MARVRRVRALVAVVLMATAFAIAPPASAITFGQLGDDNHPYVGALVVDFQGTKFLLCTGTLMTSTVFLTAGHCTADLPSAGIGADKMWVSFDPSFDDSSPLVPAAAYHTNPDYGYSGQGGFSDPHDLAVVILATPVSGPTGNLPTLNRLNTTSPSQVYTAVGYGTVRNDKTKGPASLFFDGQRRWADQTMNSLNKAWLRLSENPSTGNGGTCYGDSGGPHFFKGTNVLASITVTGDFWCRSTDVTYRVDTASARAFLGQYLSLP
jgi:secreted trypsin-like serine protease